MAIESGLRWWRVFVLMAPSYHRVSSIAQRLAIYRIPGFMISILKSKCVTSHRQKRAGLTISSVLNGLRYLTGIPKRKLVMAVTGGCYGLMAMAAILVLTFSRGPSSIESISLSIPHILP